MLYLWDVKTKKFRFRDMDISLQIPQFNAGTFGLGVEAHHSARRQFIRGRRHFQLGVRLLWLELWLFVDWRDPVMEAAMRREIDRLTAEKLQRKL